MLEPTTDTSSHAANVDDYRAVASTFIAELLPELHDAAPLLVERFDRGEPLTGSEAPSGLGFNIGLLDPVVLESFQHLMGAFRFAVMNLGLLSLVQNWWFSRGRKLREEKIVHGVEELVAHDVEMKKCIAQMADMIVALERSRGNTTPPDAARSEIASAIAAGIEQRRLLPPPSSEPPENAG
jgi:hypothetical protein